MARGNTSHYSCSSCLITKRKCFHPLVCAWSPPLTAWDDAGWAAWVSTVHFNLGLHVTRRETQPCLDCCARNQYLSLTVRVNNCLKTSWAHRAAILALCFKKKGRMLLLIMHLEQLPATPMLEVRSTCIGSLSAALSRFVVEGDEMKITSIFLF